jgi:hypothetical protein
MSPTDEREAAAQRYEAAAAELERAAAHLRWTATHFRDGEVPRGCAHTVAALGHMSNVQTQLNGLTALHATKAQI